MRDTATGRQRGTATGRRVRMAAVFLLLALIGTTGITATAGLAGLTPLVARAADAPPAPAKQPHPHAHSHAPGVATAAGDPAPQPRVVDPRAGGTSRVFQVTVTTDTMNDANCLPAGAGDCTLRQAINAANANDPGTGVNEITFAAGVTGAITLNQTFSTLIVTTYPMRITGPGQAILAIDGGCTANCGTATPTGGVPVLQTDPNTIPALTLTDLTIRNGVSNTNPISGGITTVGLVTLTNVTVSGNSALGVSGIGGGLLATYVNGNPATAPIATLTNVTATGNYASNFAGGMEIDDRGQLADGTGTLTNLVATGNTSGRDAGGIGLENVGTATGITVTNNTAQRDYGGIEIDDLLTITNLTATGNRAIGNSANTGDGGGIAVENASTLTNVIATNNTAGEYGGGIIVEDIVTINNLTVTNNTVARDGGGLYYDYPLTLTGATISGNTAGGNGGGVFSNDDNVLTNVAITNNRATGNGGGYYGDNYHRNNRVFLGLTITGNAAGGNGGGFSDQFVSVVVNATVARNTASGSGGGVYSESTPGTGPYPGYGGPAALTLDASTVSDNTANLGGGIGLNFQTNATPPTATLNDALVAGNHLAGTNPVGTDLYNIATTTFTGTYNLIGDGTGQGGTALINGAGNNRVGTTATPILPLLAPLGTYGATNGSQTLALLPGSPAIDTGACPTYTTKLLQVATTTTTTTATVTIDARGIARPQGSACDVGSFESRGFTLTNPTGGGQSTPITRAFAAPLGITLTPGDPGVPVDGGIVTFTLTPGTATGVAFANTGGSGAGCTVSNVGRTALCPISGGLATTPTIAAGTVPGTASASATGTGTGTPTTFAPLTVTQATTTTMVTAMPNPVTVSTNVTLTATVMGMATGVAPTGSVTLAVGGTNLGTVPLTNGVATFVTTLLPVGTNQTITATYNGDANFTGSVGTTTITVNKATTTTGVTAMPNPVTFGTSVTLTATVTDAAAGVTPTGSVTFTVGSANLGAAPVVNGVASLLTNALPLGANQTITATYNGDGNFTGSSGTTTITVNPQTITLTAPTGGSSGNSGSATSPLIRIGGTLPLMAQIGNTTATGVTYTSSDPTTVSVNPTTGVMTANKAGTVTITVSGPNGAMGTITVTVTGAAGTGLMPMPQPMAHPSAAAVSATPNAQPASHPTTGGEVQPQAAGNPTTTPLPQPARH